MEAVLLVLLGILALGLPHSSNKYRHRFWHPWIDNGLAPFLFGAVVVPFIFNNLDEHLLPKLNESFRALLIVALSAAGFLVGTQLRVAYIHRAGHSFLMNQTLRCLGQGAIVFIPVILILLLTTDLLLVEAIGVACLFAALAMATSQRPMKTAIYARHRSVILNHVVPAGWWNLIALVLGATAVALIIVPAYFVEEKIGLRWLIWLGVPIIMGVSLGRLAAKAHNRDEAYVFLIAIICICGGISVAKGGSALLGGILMGATFANISLGRSALVERAMEDLEQPVVVATGMLAGVCLSAELKHLYWDWTWFGISMMVILLRVLYRGWLSPTSVNVSTRSERILASPGATGVLFLGSLVLIPQSVGAIQIVQPFIVSLVALTIVYEWWGSHSLKRLQRPASPKLA